MPDLDSPRRFSRPVKRRACLALTTLVVVRPKALAALVERVLIGFTENLAPLNLQDENGPQGFSVELLRLLAADASLPLELQLLP